MATIWKIINWVILLAKLHKDDLSANQFFLISFKATDIVCIDGKRGCQKVCDATINCDSSKGLECNSFKCECTLPYKWNTQTKKCDLCADNYIKSTSSSGKVTCGK